MREGAKHERVIALLGCKIRQRYVRIPTEHMYVFRADSVFPYQSTQCRGSVGTFRPVLMSIAIHYIQFAVAAQREIFRSVHNGLGKMRSLLSGHVHQRRESWRFSPDLSTNQHERYRACAHELPVV